MKGAYTASFPMRCVPTGSEAFAPPSLPGTEALSSFKETTIPPKNPDPKVKGNNRSASSDGSSSDRVPLLKRPSTWALVVAVTLIALFLFGGSAQASPVNSQPSADASNLGRTFGCVLVKGKPSCETFRN